MGLTFARDGLQRFHARDLPWAPSARRAVEEAIAEFAASPRVAFATKALSLYQPSTARRPLILRRGCLIEESAPKTYLVQEEHPAIEAILRNPIWLEWLRTLTGFALEPFSAKLWVAVVAPPTLKRFMSQTWHRDPYDGLGQHIVKVFWYLSDVDRAAGPFEYIVGSQEVQAPAGPRLMHRYIDPAFKATLNDHPRRLTCTGPANTVLAVNTSGIHRGGYCAERQRLSATLVYSA